MPRNTESGDGTYPRSAYVFSASTSTSRVSAGRHCRTAFSSDAKANAWEKEPIATTDRKVWGQGKLFQHTLTLLAPRGSGRAKKWQSARKPLLEQGKYLVKVYVDSRGALSQDWKATLGEEDFVGQVEVTSRWPEGYGAMTTIEGSRVKK